MENITFTLGNDAATTMPDPISVALLGGVLATIGLVPVEIHRELMMAAPRWIIAAKLVSVLSLRMATRLNSLSLPKKFSMRCRHL